MAKKVLIPLADGFEDIEAITVIDVLKRAGLDVDVVGLRGISVTSKMGLRIMLDKRLDMVKPDEYDAIILPGGSEGVENLMRSARLKEILLDFNVKGKLIGAICGAPLVLAKAGLLDNRRATIYPGLERELEYPRDEKVVVDGHIVTSQGPGTAMDFALKLVEILVGSQKVAQLKQKLVVE